KNIIKLITKFYKCNYISIKSHNTFYTPAKIKNAAAIYSFNTLNSNYILFLDVDVLLSENFIQHLIKKTKTNIAFDWYPVSFLNKQFGIINFILFSYKGNLNIEESFIIQTGFVTGLQLFNSDFFYKTAGYNESFLGYGCEDIEMIHRATLLLNIRPAFNENHQYFTDDRGYMPSKLTGFRNYFYYLKRDEFSNLQITPKHFWHKRKNKSKYLKNRYQNDVKMIQIMKDFDRKFLKN
ncbi:TPA: galactosyltransferase-related protein, partial [Neisseria meningitidis]